MVDFEALARPGILALLLIVRPTGLFGRYVEEKL